MTARDTYILHTGGVDVEVERKAVRRVNLRVRPDGSARMSVPWHMERAAAQGFLDAHAAWVARAVERAKAREVQAGAADGTVPLWGKKVPLPEGTDADELYRREMATRLPEVVSRIEAASGLHASGWQLRAMTSRWGSCTPSTGRIRINVRLAAYDPVCLDYVVAHELCHLEVPGHGPEFHARLARFFPDEKGARRMLRRAPCE